MLILVISQDVLHDKYATIKKEKAKFKTVEQNDTGEFLIPSSLITKEDLATFKTQLFDFVREQFSKAEKNSKAYRVGLDSKIANIQLEMVQLKTLVQDKRPFGDSEHVLSLEKLKEIDDVTLPMETSTEFYNFNSKIVHDNYISLKTYFGCNINTQEKNIAAKVITPIFKTFFSKDLVRKFTAQKK
ncbi:uncharacterized protein LOC107982095 [Nasonia vitripennis]|uniref:Uncharacterized protein n=1 Tax=Nasonia vitripennis TaxID=7425 RepID=A0A7M7IW14_NASVI|nr:uncharacterized protein LOC107982095 [Nasonia vitripennis]